MTEAKHKLSLPSLGLECDIWGEGLVQSLGTIKGREFYFRARHPNWTFEVADDSGQLPSDAGGNRIFFVEGWYSNSRDMTVEEASHIIERCAGMYAELIAF